MALAEIITTIIAVAAFAAIVGYVLFVGYVPKSISMHSVASRPENDPCLFQKPSQKFDAMFLNKMPINMTCADFNKLLQAG
ncbi:MAG: hypothetical protein DLM72_10050 [Candidatus Nitrosopolaris wilkensis]|nr:MAG: hypothetical protein DLM72_10050 [Candidatus Nitrosopolaris wilkensis]